MAIVLQADFPVLPEIAPFNQCGVECQESVEPAVQLCLQLRGWPQFYEHIPDAGAETHGAIVFDFNLIDQLVPKWVVVHLLEEGEGRLCCCDVGCMACAKAFLGPRYTPIGVGFVLMLLCGWAIACGAVVMSDW